MPKRNIHEVFIEIAKTVSTMSYAEKRKVGCVIVKDKRIIATGYNGTPSGMDNICEEVVKLPESERVLGNMYGHKTKPHVIHAEMNAILNAGLHGVSCQGASMYITLAPCDGCAKHVIQAGIKAVYYLTPHKPEGLVLLQEANIHISRIKL